MSVRARGPNFSYSTAGHQRELQRFAAFTVIKLVFQNKRKFVCVDPHDIPVVAIVDRDDLGKKWAEQVEAALTGEARSLTFKEAKTGKDASDHILDGHELDDLVDVEAAADDKLLATLRAGDWLDRQVFPALQWVVPGIIPEGMSIHCIELVPGQGAKLARSAGQYAVLRSKEGNYAQVKLPSGEIRLIHQNCRATVGQVGNLEHSSIVLGKAGKKRYLGRRPHVRGVAQNPVDHPMGGGEGRTSGGGHPRSPWGQLAKGYKTRKPKKASDRFILERRKK